MIHAMFLMIEPAVAPCVLMGAAWAVLCGPGHVMRGFEAALNWSIDHMRGEG